MSNPVISSLHVVSGFDNALGGSVHAALNVCKYLQAAGQHVELIGTHEQGDDIAYLENTFQGLECHRMQKSFPRRYRNSRQLDAWLHANLHRFDLVELHSVWLGTTWVAARACGKRGVPYLVRPHGSLDPFDLQKHSWLKRMVGPLYVRSLLGRAKAVICTAELEAQRLEAYGAQVATRVMPLPVPLPPTLGVRERFRARAGIPQDSEVVLFLSRLDYKKGLQFLIPAVASLRREFPRLRLVLAGAGEGAFVQAVHGWIRDHGIDEITHRIGFVSGEDKWDAFAGADVFALPSLNENFGLVNIEAMHARVPVVISDQVYIAEEVRRANAGVICEPSVDSVVVSLRRVLSSSKDARAELGECGRGLVERAYRPESATEALLSTYHAILNDEDPK
jgi:glycosyltransferase involved in cell wall biosynthesis